MSLETVTHKAVHDALLADAALTALIGTRVYDKPPGPAPAYPYLVLDVDVREDATTCSDASEAHVTVHVWSNKVGSKEAKDIGGLVRGILAPPEAGEYPAIAGYETSGGGFDLAIYRDGGETLLTEGVLTFTYLVDPS